jgi:hypothetical protein
VSPIITRPIREQLEHDRVIRQLEARYKRKHEVAINPGPEQNQSVMVGDLAVFPDLLLYSQERAKRLEATVEVETGESVNQLEALAEWGVFSKLKAPFYLYVPPQSLDSARRICDEHQFPVAEIWTYHLALDQIRFTQVYRSPNAPKPAASPRVANDKPVSNRAARDASRSAARKPASPPAPKALAPVRNGKPARNDKPVAGAKTANGKAATRLTAKTARPASAARKNVKLAKGARARGVVRAAASKRTPAARKRR